MRISSSRLLALILAVSCLVGIVSAQTQGADTVYVAVTVTGQKNAPVPVLKARDFQLFEDGVEQKVTTFLDAAGSWDINVLLAISQLRPGRVDGLSAAIRDAADAFKEVARPRNSVRIEELTFGSDGMYAAIDQNLVDLQKSANPRRALVVITDGFDRPYRTQGGAAADLSANVDSNSAGKLLEFSRKLNIPIYFIYSYHGVGQTLSNTELHDKDTLISVADQTGGRLETVDTYDRLAIHCRELAEELRNKYFLGFTSTNPKKDDKWRSLKLKFTPPEGQKLEASMKKKYFVPKPPKK